MAQELNKNKVVVGILALLTTIGAVIGWVMKLKYKKPIGAGLLVLISAIAIAFWVWYANLPTWNDVGDKTYDQIDQTWSTVTKGDLK